MLKCKELIEYLQRFDADEGIGFVIVDIQKRLHHITAGYDLLAEEPAILLETTQSEPLENIAEEATENDRL